MPNRSSIRVALAEDGDAMREALADLIRSEARLELAGVAADAPSVIELVERERPDVAVIDVRMPGGGQAAARGIARCSPETQIVALSAHDDRATVLEMVEAGVIGYVVKGAPVETLIEAIERAAAGKGTLSTAVTGDVINELTGHLATRREETELHLERRARVTNALEDDAVLELVFQPISRLDDGTIGAAEALSRFRCDPPRTPDLWFAEAEKVGLRTELEVKAIERAFSALPALPPAVAMSVNASPDTLRAPAFDRALDGVDAVRVIVEITEHAPIGDYDAFRVALDRSRARGVRIAVDDAGAGFASLQHILRLAPDFIKLDRTLIDGIETDGAQQALAAGLISFAEKLGARIVAEGIESEEQLTALVGLGAEYGQGYFLGRPGPLPLVTAG